MGENHGRDRGHVPQNLEWGKANTNFYKLSPRFSKIPLIIHTNTPFQAKNLFFFMADPSPDPLPGGGLPPPYSPAKLSGSALRPCQNFSQIYATVIDQ